MLPPGAIMTISDGRLHLRERGAGAGERAPVDLFFNSLAEDCGENAIGIVLSGSGSDGTLGIKSIKEGPSRLEKARQALKSLGGELKSFHLVQGRYDAIVIAEAPNDEVLARFALATGSQGNVRTETMRAFNEEEYRRIIAGLP